MVYRILSCGSNGNYQLGLQNDEDQNTLQESHFRDSSNNQNFSNVVSARPILISCGGNHTLVLFDGGEVYSCGDNRVGQCGHSTSKQHVVGFHKILGSDWKFISCGWEFSVLINNSQEVFVCGSGLKGELGLGENTKQTELKKLDISIPTEIKEIKSSVHHSILRLIDDTLIGWGSCRKGQLGAQPEVDVRGNPHKRSIMWKPERLNFNICHFSHFSLGRESSAFLKDDHLMVFGKLTKNIRVCDAVDLKSMWSSYHVVTIKDGQLNVESFGNNSHSQHFPGPSKGITSFESGTEHGIVTLDNKVKVWGWGEHGNCGIQSRESIVYDHMNTLYSGNEKVVMIAGGSATTWVVIDI